jgi:hypothetical protein
MGQRLQGRLGLPARIIISADKFLSSDEAGRDKEVNPTIYPKLQVDAPNMVTGEGVSSEVTSIDFCVIYCLSYLVELSRP